MSNLCIYVFYVLGGFSNPVLIQLLSLFPPCISDEVAFTIQSLKNGISCGPNNTPIKLLNIFNSKISAHLTLVNESFRTGTFPEKLQIAKVIPVYKKGSTTILPSYRPTSLSHVFSKIF